MIYLDNSASSLIKPKNVQKAVLNALNIFTANPGRSGHKQAIKTALEVEKVRELVAKHVGTTAEKAIFNFNCTEYSKKFMSKIILSLYKINFKGGFVSGRITSSYYYTIYHCYFCNQAYG